jgi:N-acetyl-alpha-D-muramate 1-phosphate uridylyltransferase
MKAMILAAGVGERMRPLTDHTPKPLLTVDNKPLIQYHLERLGAAGFRDIVINASHLASQIIDFCGDGSRWGVSVRYSREETPLETAGGIYQALPLLGDAPFLIVNGDVWTDFPFETLAGERLRPGEEARLVFVDNPPQHPDGDFLLDDDGWVLTRPSGQKGCTYAGMGIYSSALLSGLAPGKVALRPYLDNAIERRALGGQFYAGEWADVGTPARLEALDRQIRSPD